jgi:hypothetical protein
MPPAAIGTWTGEITEPRGLAPKLAATYMLRPCASDGACGTWEFHGPFVKEDPNYPFAVAGQEWRCAGGLAFRGLEDESFVFTQWTTDADPAESINACGTWRVHLTPMSGGALDYVLFSGHSTVLMRGTLRAEE